MFSLRRVVASAALAATASAITEGTRKFTGIAHKEQEHQSFLATAQAVDHDHAPTSVAQKKKYPGPINQTAGWEERPLSDQPWSVQAYDWKKGQQSPSTTNPNKAPILGKDEIGSTVETYAADDLARQYVDEHDEEGEESHHTATKGVNKDDRDDTLKNVLIIVACVVAVGIVTAVIVICCCCKKDSDEKEDEAGAETAEGEGEAGAGGDAAAV